MTDEFDFAEVRELQTVLEGLGAAAVQEVSDVVGGNAAKIKYAAKASVGHGIWRGAGNAINYDVEGGSDAGGSYIKAEIGYDKDIAGGSIGNLREFGAPNAPNVVFGSSGGKQVIIPIAGSSNPLAPHNDLLNALEKQEQYFADSVSKAAADAEKKAGL